MSEDNSHSAAETETDEKGQKVARPLHRRITNDQFGGGVLIIVLIEVIVGAIGHWNSPEVKSILTVGILWLSYWLYAEVRYSKGASKIKAGSMATLLALAAFCIAGLAYASLGNQQSAKPQGQVAQSQPTPQPSPSQVPSPTASVPTLAVPIATPLAAAVTTAPIITPAVAPQVTVAPPPAMVSSKITPEEICEKVRSALPFQKEVVASGFVGTPVKWKLGLYRVKTIMGKPSVTFLGSEKTVPVLVFTTVGESDIPLLRSAKEKEEFIVSGTIKEVTWGDVTLESVKIAPAN